MTREEKIKFVDDLITNIKLEVLWHIEKMPERWDGVELRAYIASRFFSATAPQVLKGKRKKDYTNDILISGL